jgi:hypothetical protein
MIVVRVELWSARTGKKTELARMHIINTGESAGRRRNYHVETLRGRSSGAFAKRVVQRASDIARFPSEAIHVWNLVRLALSKMGYVEGE